MFNTYENTNIKFLTDAENALTGGAGYVLDQPGYDIYAVGISDYYYDDDRLENDFIFYDSDTRYLTDEEVKGLSLQVVCYAKNEIYARRGRIFDSQELNDYFYSSPGIMEGSFRKIFLPMCSTNTSWQTSHCWMDTSVHWIPTAISSTDTTRSLLSGKKPGSRFFLCDSP